MRISNFFYFVIFLFVGYTMLRYSNWFWLGATLLLMLLSVGLGHYLRKR
ncbi:hypothetical protein [Loigolactobacillus zhaoyuanensis]|uniref:Uncharacterized protein n=1 Tax=Loigolactobacillus zhaoyuanensis TaxID=2486017 RepID=A0ABW8UDG2_9LACO|nr:hypothetical protein [Loigolactobacillus zhaoyuanensis]